MPKNNILITGFGPFNEFKSNPSGLIAMEFGERYKDNITCEVLPVDYLPARRNLLALLQDNTPEVCICMGLAMGNSFRIETKARKPREYELFEGETQYTSLIPDNVKNYCEAHPDFKLSSDCGQYVCEATLWTLLNYCNTNNMPTSAFFLHIPAICKNWPYSKTLSVCREFFESVLISPITKIKRD